MENKILLNIKNARKEKFIKSILICIVLFLIGLLLVQDEESDMSVLGIICFWLPSLIFFIISIQKLFLFLNSEENNLFYRLNKFGTVEDICNYIEKEMDNIIYEDEKIIITSELFVNRNNWEETFLNSEILDVKHLTHKINYIIDYITISILYSDGKNYHFKYKRPLGISDMDQKVKETLKATSILTQYSENLRSKKVERKENDIVENYNNKKIKCKVCEKEIFYNEHETCEECHKKIMERINNKKDKKIYCTNCGKEIDTNWKFCKYCGHEQK